MQQIVDLHIHSKYSRACSPQLDLPHISRFCQIKGIDIVATGDFTHPAWFANIKNQLEEIGKSGLYQLKNKFKIKNDDFRDFSAETKFILGTELALVYKKNNKARRLHLLVLAPNIKAGEKLNSYLEKKYNIHSDGRPILGMSAEELCQICFGFDDKFMIIPAHIWTPWFAVFGSKSGFDSLEECFGKWTPKIKAVETGLSSDPEMNWTLSALDKITLISNSDAHSLPNLGREVNIFDLENPSYREIKQAIETRGSKKFLKTIEFYPEEGMYHFDGHRTCGIRFSPEETKKQQGLCPICHKPLVIGVANRVAKLADRKIGFQPVGVRPFIKLVELDKIIAKAFNLKSRSAKKVQQKYKEIINLGGSEINIILNLKTKELLKIAGEKITEGILKVRNKEVIVEPGFDGQYGKIIIYPKEKEKIQKNLL